MFLLKRRFRKLIDNGLERVLDIADEHYFLLLFCNFCFALKMGSNSSVSLSRYDAKYNAGEYAMVKLRQTDTRSCAVNSKRLFVFSAKRVRKTKRLGPPTLIISDDCKLGLF